MELSRSMPEGPLALVDAGHLLVAGYTELTGAPPTRALARLMLAQVWMEGDRGRKMWRNNWGNLMAGPEWRARMPYWRPNWWEIDDDSTSREKWLHAEMLAGRIPEAFRAYPSHRDGVLAYLKLVTRSQKYASLVAAGEADDPHAYALANQAAYCPDCKVGPTAKTLESLRDSFKRQGLFAGLSERVPRGFPRPGPRPLVGMAPIVLSVGAVLAAAALRRAAARA